jgi:hypothetical protein
MVLEDGGTPGSVGVMGSDHRPRGIPEYYYKILFI